MSACTCKVTEHHTTFDAACPLHGDEGTMHGRVSLKPPSLTAQPREGPILPVTEEGRAVMEVIDAILSGDDDMPAGFDYDNAATAALNAAGYSGLTEGDANLGPIGRAVTPEDTPPYKLTIDRCTTCGAQVEYSDDYGLVPVDDCPTERRCTVYTQATATSTGPVNYVPGVESIPVVPLSELAPLRELAEWIADRPIHSQRDAGLRWRARTALGRTDG
jgi:hypothetical protein